MKYRVQYVAEVIVEVNPENYDNAEAFDSAVMEEAQRKAGFGFDTNSATFKIID